MLAQRQHQRKSFSTETSNNTRQVRSHQDVAVSHQHGFFDKVGDYMTLVGQADLEAAIVASANSLKARALVAPSSPALSYVLFW